MLFTNQKSIAPTLGLSNEVLCTFLAQGTTKRWEFKFEVRKYVASRQGCYRIHLVKQEFFSDLHPFCSPLSKEDE